MHSGCAAPDARKSGVSSWRGDYEPRSCRTAVIPIVPGFARGAAGFIS